VNVEKDFSDSKIDIKIYQTKFLSKPEWSKIQVEIFQIENPSLIFRCDYFSSNKQNGRQVLIERFNLTDQIEITSGLNSEASSRQDIPGEEEDETRSKGMVFSISETSFPHQFNFMLLEPCSHIFWQYNYQDNKLNMMERRVDKQSFAQLLLNSVKGGVLREVNDREILKVQPGYQVENVNQDSSKKMIKLLVPHKSLQEHFGHDKDTEMKLIYGETLNIEEGNFRDVKIFTDQGTNKLVLTSNRIEVDYSDQNSIQSNSNVPSRTGNRSNASSPLKKGEKEKEKEKERQSTNEFGKTKIEDFAKAEIEMHFLLVNEKEAARYFQGVLVGGKHPLIYQIE
jgi:hypothetical protein